MTICVPLGGIASSAKPSAVADVLHLMSTKEKGKQYRNKKSDAKIVGLRSGDAVHRSASREIVEIKSADLQFAHVHSLTHIEPEYAKQFQEIIRNHL